VRPGARAGVVVGQRFAPVVAELAPGRPVVDEAHPLKVVSVLEAQATLVPEAAAVPEKGARLQLLAAPEE